MFKFNKNDDLLATIEKQKEQLGRYENRLRDVVAAYKSLQNEKQALENSMKALTSVAPGHVADRKKKTTETTKQFSESDAESVDGSTAASSLDQTNHSDQADTEEPHTDEDSNLQHLQSQVFTLTQSLSTMSAEKTKMVATYQAEKKKLKQEQELETKILQEESEIYSKKAAMLEEELTRLKERTRIQQSEREQEQATHSIMLREIQRMLNDERMKNEASEATIKELRSSAHHAEVEAQQSEDYKRRVRQLEDELEKVRKRLHMAEEEASKPPPLLLQLQEEMTNMKVAHQIQLEREHARVAEVEQRERDVAHSEEERVAELESRLIQISNKIGSYDGKRQKDQLSIQHLKDRIAQLDIENTLLAKQVEAGKNDKLDERAKLDDDLDIDGLKERIMNCQHLLKEAASKSNEPVDLTDVLTSLQRDSEDYRKLYFESQQELLQLKEEFERYKIRAQGVLKNMKSGSMTSPSSAGNRELEELKEQLTAARERHFLLRGRCDDLEAKCTQMGSDHEKEMEKLMVVHRAEVDKLKEEHHRQMSSKDKETRTQRERTVAMLADKDKEIKQLKIYTAACHSEYQGGDLTGGTIPQDPRRFSSIDESRDTSDEPLSEMLRTGGYDKNIIHYVEQLARKDVTINSIRRHKKQLELQLRQQQDASITKDEKHAQDIAVLKEKILEQERGVLRENANLEYLKNVFHRFLTTVDHTAKQRMLTAMTTILQFSPEECRSAGVKR